MSHNENTPTPAPCATPASLRERVLELIALIVLLASATVAFIIAGPDAGVVASVGVGLFAAWRKR